MPKRGCEYAENDISEDDENAATADTRDCEPAEQVPRYIIGQVLDLPKGKVKIVDITHSNSAYNDGRIYYTIEGPGTDDIQKKVCAGSFRRLPRGGKKRRSRKRRSKISSKRRSKRSYKRRSKKRRSKRR